jgi:hypothetical protein
VPKHEGEPLKSDKKLRIVFETFFALNVAWPAITYFRWRSHRVWLPILWRPLIPFLEHLSQYSRIAEPRVVLQQLTASVLLAMYILLFLRLVAWFSVTRLLLRTLGGAIALVGFPIFALCFRDMFTGPIYPTGSEHVMVIQPTWFYLEIVIVLACGILFLLKRWVVPAVVSIALLVLHFGFWSWVTGSYIRLSLQINLVHYGVLAFLFWSLFSWGFPLFAFLSSLAWGRYVEFPSSARPST